MVKEHWKDGTLCCIEEIFIPYFKEILQDYNPEIVIELGTYKGGLIKYFIEWLPHIPIYSIDSHYLLSLDDAILFRKHNVINIITSQIFKGEYMLPMLLSLPIKKFLFCDNGYRNEEFQTFAGYLRPGDMLGTHDWGEDIQYEEVKHILKEFDDHYINETIDKADGLTCCRFWTKKDRGKNIKKEWNHKDEKDRYNEDLSIKT